MHEGDDSSFMIGFTAGVIMILTLCALISSCGTFPHDVGADQKACLTIVDDGSRKYKSCATGTEIIDYLRRRDGVTR